MHPYGSASFQIAQKLSRPEEPPMKEVCDTVKSAAASYWSKMPGVAPRPRVKPSGWAFQTKFRMTMSGVRFVTIILGLPGMKSLHARPM